MVAFRYGTETNNVVEQKLMEGLRDFDLNMLCRTNFYFEFFKLINSATA